MSKPRYNWWGYIKNVIRDYPGLKREYEELHKQSITASSSGMPSGGGVSRAVENIALRELPKPKQLDYDAVRLAREVTGIMRTGNDRIQLIDMVFWKGTHTLQGAAFALHISYETAVEYHRDFIMVTAYYHGNVESDELTGIQKLALKSQKPVL